MLLLGKTVSSTDNQYGNADNHISDTTSKIANDDFFNTNQEDNIHCHINGHNVYVSDLGCGPADKVLNATPSKGKRGVKTKAATAPKSTLTRGKRVAKAKAATATKSMPTKSKRGAKTKASSTLADPFDGKAIAFRCNGGFGEQLFKEFRKKSVEEAVCYHLDAKVGHLVGTAMWKRKGIGKTHHNQINYDVVWEFSSLGETNVPYSHLLDGNKVAETLLRSRSKLKSSISVGGDKKDASCKDHVHKKEAFGCDSRILKVRDNLCTISDDEAEMKVSVLLLSRNQIY